MSMGIRLIGAIFVGTHMLTVLFLRQECAQVLIGLSTHSSQEYCFPS